MATTLPQRPTCRTCIFFDLAGSSDPDKGTCNYVPASMSDVPDDEGGFYPIPDPDVRTNRVACTEYVQFSVREQ